LLPRGANQGTLTLLHLFFEALYILSSQKSLLALEESGDDDYSKVTMGRCPDKNALLLDKEI
jgi:hypothetical protein